VDALHTAKRSRRSFGSGCAQAKQQRDGGRVVEPVGETDTVVVGTHYDDRPETEARSAQKERVSAKVFDASAADSLSWLATKAGHWPCRPNRYS
jgi:hypothetical protein